MTQIRAATAADHEPIATVVETAFGADGASIAGIVDTLRHREQMRAEFVAESDGEVVGHVGLSTAWLDARERLVDVWVLSPLSVLPTHEKRGYGAALVAAAIAAAEAGGIPALFLEGSPNYYGRLGFQRASTLGFEPPSRRIPDGAFQVVVGAAREGWMRGRLIYPEVWWQHEATGLRDPLLAELEESFGAS